MNKVLPLIVFSILMFPLFVFAENGLERLIVEKYYVAGKKDVRASAGKLKKGAVTYRIYADLNSGYTFQAAYGIPGHPLNISTTTYFYNSPTVLAAIANEVPIRELSWGTTMIDSWLSAGAACDNCFGIMKNDDTTGAAVNKDGLLKNASPEAGEPLTKRDGLFPASPMKQVVLYGIDSLSLQVFRITDQKVNGQRFETDNGSWACMTGSAGASAENKVLIAQLTTDGELSFKLNIRIGTPFGGVQNFVAENPAGDEIYLESLTYPAKITGTEAGSPHSHAEAKSGQQR